MSHLMNDSILVTGGAGFIGSCLVRQWLALRPGKVVNLDKLTYAGCLESLAAARDDPRHVFVQGDIGDMDLVSRLLDEHRPAAVIHLAAESHVDRSIDGPDAFFDTNVAGTFQLLKAAHAYWGRLDDPARSAFRFVYVSTDEVYGSANQGEAFHETTPMAPNSPYAASKAAAGHFVRAFWRTYGLPTLQTMCANNYGPYQFPEKLLPLIILNALEGRPLPVYGDGQQCRDWLYVEDHCDALIRVLEQGRPGESYHIGSGVSRPNLEVVQQLCQVIDRLRPGLPHAPCSSLIQMVTDRPGHDRLYAIDVAKIRDELGWSPRREFDTGLQETVQWYLDNQAWIAHVDQRYQRQRLGLESADPPAGSDCPAA